MVVNMIEENKNCWLTDTCNHIDCNGFCLKHFKLDYLYTQALISNTQRKYTALYLDEDNRDLKVFTELKEIENNIVNFVSAGKNIYIYSAQAGNGKTSWSLRLVQAYFNHIWLKSELTCRALFISVPKFLLALKDNISEKSDYISHIKENMFNADIIIWDDIATKSITQFEAENLFSIIDTRIASGKTNIYTSNLTLDDLHASVGDRLYSRIANLSYCFELTGADKRGLQNK